MVESAVCRNKALATQKKYMIKQRTWRFLCIALGKHVRSLPYHENTRSKNVEKHAVLRRTSKQNEVGGWWYFTHIFATLHTECVCVYVFGDRWKIWYTPQDRKPSSAQVNAHAEATPHFLCAKKKATRKKQNTENNFKSRINHLSRPNRMESSSEERA